VKCLLPEAVAHLADELKAHKPALINLLQRRGGRVATFPRCPKCCSHALYRENNLGAFECLTCGMAGIEEHIARRVQ
jgi:Zn ribbon nucleic-acid-binding protein